MTRLRASRNYPSLPAISDEPRSHTLALRSVIEALDIHERRTNDINSSFVRIKDLIDMNLISVVDGRFNLTLPLAGSSAGTGSGSNSYAFFVGG